MERTSVFNEVSNFLSALPEQVVVCPHVRLDVGHLLHPALVRHLLPLAPVRHVLPVRLGADQVAAPFPDVGVGTFGPNTERTEHYYL